MLGRRQRRVTCPAKSEAEAGRAHGAMQFRGHCRQYLGMPSLTMRLCCFVRRHWLQHGLQYCTAVGGIYGIALGLGDTDSGFGDIMIPKSCPSIHRTKVCSRHIEYLAMIVPRCAASVVPGRCIPASRRPVKARGVSTTGLHWGLRPEFVTSLHRACFDDIASTSVLDQREPLLSSSLQLPPPPQTPVY